MKKALLALFLLFSVSLFGKDVRLTVHVVSAINAKPIDRASVIVTFKSGVGVNLKKIQTRWETKTNQDGTAELPLMPQGKITVQVIAPNYQTFGDAFETNQEQQTIEIKLNPPQAQYSQDAQTTAVPK